MADTSTANAKAKAKGQVRNKRTWTAEEDEKLIEALMVLHASRKYGAENGFKPGYNQAVQNLLDISLPNSGLKADPHIKSRLKTWRTNFSIVHDMILGSNTSGFGWDPDKCVLTAPDDVWDSYLKTHPEATKFRDKSFPLYHKLSTVFGKDRANGSRAIDLGDDDVVSATEDTPPVDHEDADIDTSVWQDTRQRQREENLRNWNWEEVIDVDMIPDEDIIDVDMIPDEEVNDADMILDEEFVDDDMILDEEFGNGLHLEELFGLRLTDEDIMPNGVRPNMPNINAQRDNTIQVLNRHRVYSVLD
ncbi:hypothetical protein CTI12_AA236870 [Artemisia annua]|uniref:Myb/SANT-like domain-containing protein n=1 Tax=Artemisia annua TaxID=35608 RepID=A0A2U1N6T4_ARTAN|nr:hypothetical protein CTI12_AA236870 [Artemisia annua]